MMAGGEFAGHGVALVFFFSSRRRHTRLQGDWSSDVCSSDLAFDQHRLEGLNAETMQRGSAVEQDGMILDDFFEDVPDYRIVLLDELFGLLEIGRASCRERV